MKRKGVTLCELRICRGFYCDLKRFILKIAEKLEQWVVLETRVISIKDDWNGMYQVLSCELTEITENSCLVKTDSLLLLKHLLHLNSA